MGPLKIAFSTVLAIVLTPYLFPSPQQRLVNTLLIYHPQDLNNTYYAYSSIISPLPPLSHSILGCFSPLQVKSMMYLRGNDTMARDRLIMG